jgi:hypothetical protein
MAMISPGPKSWPLFTALQCQSGGALQAPALSDSSQGRLGKEDSGSRCVARVSSAALLGNVDGTKDCPRTGGDAGKPPLTSEPTLSRAPDRAAMHGYQEHAALHPRVQGREQRPVPQPTVMDHTVAVSCPPARLGPGPCVSQLQQLAGNRAVSRRQIQPVEACASTSSVNSSEGFFQL